MQVLSVHVSFSAARNTDDDVTHRGPSVLNNGGCLAFLNYLSQRHAEIPYECLILIAVCPAVIMSHKLMHTSVSA